jgi:hypothetical protein
LAIINLGQICHGPLFHSIVMHTVLVNNASSTLTYTLTEKCNGCFVWLTNILNYFQKNKKTLKAYLKLKNWKLCFYWQKRDTTDHCAHPQAIEGYIQWIKPPRPRPFIFLIAWISNFLSNCFLTRNMKGKIHQTVVPRV